MPDPLTPEDVAALGLPLPAEVRVAEGSECEANEVREAAA
jgi:hypothetical protein